MAASRPKKLKKKLKKRAASRRQKAKKCVFYLFILLKKNPAFDFIRIVLRCYLELEAEI